ncbi:MAG: ComEA family DNA-binding protein [Lachnospiraceae bacterium]|nr:ComEA family DNA-binding protein [Lachnospiraceae bacterium]
MRTDAQKKNDKLKQKKIKKLVKTAGAVLLVILGFIYWYNGNGKYSAENETEYESGSVKNSRDQENEKSDDITDIKKKSDNLVAGSGKETDNGQSSIETDTGKAADDKKPGPENEQGEYETEIKKESDKLYDENGRLNINIADKTELMKLNGIGEKRAQDIIDYRTINGRFKRIEDIMKVKGIKQGIFSKIKDYIYV